MTAVRASLGFALLLAACGDDKPPDCHGAAGVCVGIDPLNEPHGGTHAVTTFEAEQLQPFYARVIAAVRERTGVAGVRRARVVAQPRPRVAAGDEIVVTSAADSATVTITPR